jgi:hypothetical protein
MDPYEIVEQGGVPELTAWVRGLVVGSITVVEVEYSAGPDPQDRPLLSIDLILSNPVDGPFWPEDDLWALKTRVRAKCWELELGNWNVDVFPASSRRPAPAAEAGGA